MNEKRQLQITATVNDQASKGFKRISDQLKSLGKTARGALNSLPNLVAAIAAGAAIRKGVQVFSELASGLDEVNQASASVNATAESLYLLRAAAGENGIEFSELAAALRTFEVAVGDARLGSVAQREALQRLGLDVSALAGKNKDAVENFALVADALGTVEDASIRTKLALQLFGEDTGAKLLPLLQKGGTALRNFAAAQIATGKSLTSEQIRRTSDYRLAVAGLTNTLQTFAEQVVVEVAPALKDLFENLKRQIDENGPAIRDGMIDILVVLTEGVELIVNAGFIVRRSIQGWDLLGKALAKVYFEMFGNNAEVAISNRKLNESNEAIKANDRAWEELGDRFDALRGKIQLLRNAQSAQAKEAGRVPTRGATVEVSANLPTDTDLFFEGFRENVEKAKARWSDFYQAGLDASQQLVDRGLNSLADAFGDIIVGAKTAKDAFRELARSLLSDLARIIARMLIMKALQAGGSLLGFADGGVVKGDMGKPVKTEKFARGGIATGPTLALFGEGRGAEAFVPLPDGRTIPVTMNGGGGGGGTTINFNISAVDGQSVKRMLIAEGDTIAAVIQSKVQGRSVPFRQAMQRATT